MVRESETSTNNSEDADQIPFTGEAAARLLTRVVGVLGGPPEWTNDLEVSLRGLASGFKELSPIFPSASVWSQRLQHLLELKPPVQTHDTEPIPVHAIALLLAKQAAVTSRREVSAARAVGALVFYTLYRGQHPESELLGVAQAVLLFARRALDCLPQEFSGGWQSAPGSL